MDKTKSNKSHNTEEEKNIPKVSEMNPLQDQVEELKKQLDEANQKSLRTLADYQNLVRRVEKEKQDWIKFANEGLLERILDISDNLDRAAEFIKDQGLAMVRSQMVQLLTDHGVVELEAIGRNFDPASMECVDKTKGDKNKVLEVRQKGYKLHEKVIRPAKVVVGE